MPDMQTMIYVFAIVPAAMRRKERRKENDTIDRGTEKRERKHITQVKKSKRKGAGELPGIGEGTPQTQIVKGYSFVPHVAASTVCGLSLKAHLLL